MDNINFLNCPNEWMPHIDIWLAMSLETIRPLVPLAHKIANAPQEVEHNLDFGIIVKDMHK
jgi:hypothetical protein